MAEKDKAISVIVEMLREASLDKLHVIATSVESYLRSKPT